MSDINPDDLKELRVLGLERRDPPPTFAVDDVVVGYRIVSPPHRGGMAEVYRARPTAREFDVAFKTIRPDQDSSVNHARFQREIDLLNRVDKDQRLTPLIESGTLPNGHPYLVLPWLQGAPLRGITELEHGLQGPEALQIALDVAQAMAYLHAHGIVHRDINPRNVIVDRTKPQASLYDLGLAFDLYEHDPQELTNRRPVGTPGYIAPEQVLGASPSPAFDIWSFGSLLLNLIGGQELSPSAALGTLELPPRPSLSPLAELHDLARRCLNKEPNQRPTAKGLFRTLGLLQKNPPLSNTNPHTSAVGEIPNADLPSTDLTSVRQAPQLAQDPASSDISRREHARSHNLWGRPPREDTQPHVRHDAKAPQPTSPASDPEHRVALPNQEDTQPHVRHDPTKSPPVQSRDLTSIGPVPVRTGVTQLQEQEQELTPFQQVPDLAAPNREIDFDDSVTPPPPFGKTVQTQVSPQTQVSASTQQTKPPPATLDDQAQSAITNALPERPANHAQNSSTFQQDALDCTQGSSWPTTSSSDDDTDSQPHVPAVTSSSPLDSSPPDELQWTKGSSWPRSEKHKSLASPTSRRLVRAALPTLLLGLVAAGVFVISPTQSQSIVTRSSDPQPSALAPKSPSPTRVLSNSEQAPRELSSSHQGDRKDIQNPGSKEEIAMARAASHEANTTIDTNKKTHSPSPPHSAQTTPSPQRNKHHTKQRTNDQRSAEECKGLIADFKAAKTNRDWATAIKLSGRSSQHCWSSVSAWERDRITVLVAAKQFDQCLALAKRATNRRVQSYAEVCKGK